jgi:nucleoside-diphosphate-sugar epimerase
VSSGADAIARGTAEGRGTGSSSILTGATGLVGRCLLPRLGALGFTIQAVSRRPGGGRRNADTVRWVEMDLARSPSGTRGGSGTLWPARCLFHAAPIWLLPAWLPTFAEAGVRRLVAVSSTSRFTKEDSGNATERETARRLAEAEGAVEVACRESGIRWTILRPTLVYGGGRDQNVSAVARFVRRFGFFPLAGEGAGRRQPVHADDVAGACLAVLDRPATFDRAYETPGGETVTYREMVSRIARGVGRRPRLVRVPLPILRGAFAVAGRFPGLGHVTPDMADRMEADLVFEAEDARRDFGYDPRPFRFPDQPDLGEQ